MAGFGSGVLCDVDLWLSGVRRSPSPNCDFRPAGAEVSLLVIHNISLPPGEYGSGCIDALFTNRLDCSQHPVLLDLEGLKVSAHLVIDRSGCVVQYVPFNRRAWHAGQSCYRGRNNCNDFSIGIELEGVDQEPYEVQQIVLLTEIVALLIRKFPGLSLQAIVGHSEIAPNRKTDPGPAFEWQQFLASVQRIFLLNQESG